MCKFAAIGATYSSPQQVTRFESLFLKIFQSLAALRERLLANKA